MKWATGRKRCWREPTKRCTPTNAPQRCSSQRLSSWRQSRPSSSSPSSPGHDSVSVGERWVVQGRALGDDILFPQVSSDGSDYTFGDADVRIGDVKTMLFNVFQTLFGIHPRPWLSIPAQVYRLKGGPRGKLRGRLAPIASSVKPN